MLEPYAVVWCDSPLGLVSVRVDRLGEPCSYIRSEIPPQIALCENAAEVFTTLGRRDGTKIAVPYNSLYIFFGWNF